MEHFQFSVALDEIWKLIRRSNKYVDETEPWILAKDDAKKDRLNTVLYNLCESLRIVSVLIYPFIKNTSEEIRTQLGLSNEIKWEDAKEWGKTKNGTKVSKGRVIFPRLDIDEEIEKLRVENEKVLKERATPESSKEDKLDDVKDEVSLTDFDKLDIRLALVESVEDHPNADKLYVLNLKIGSEKRQIVTNIKNVYKKEKLEGKKILVIVNLKPVEIRGVKSYGMLLAAKDEEGKLSVATTLEDISDGAKIS